MILGSIVFTESDKNFLKRVETHKKGHKIGIFCWQSETAIVSENAHFFIDFMPFFVRLNAFLKIFLCSGNENLKQNVFVRCALWRKCTFTLSVDKQSVTKWTRKTFFKNIMKKESKKWSFFIRQKYLSVILILRCLFMLHSGALTSSR
jgi:hypothetical protein